MSQQFITPSITKAMSIANHNQNGAENIDRQVVNADGSLHFIRTIEINYWPVNARETVQQEDVKQQIIGMCNNSVEIAMKGKYFAGNSKGNPARGEYPLFVEISGWNWIDCENARKHVEEIADYMM